MLVNSSAGQGIVGANFLSLLSSSLLTWMYGLFNWFSWFVVKAIFHHDSGSVIRSKLHKPFFLPAFCSIGHHCPVYLVLASGVSLYVWSELVCMVFFRKFISPFALLFWPSGCELWFTINRISEKWIVNTCKMSTLRVNFLAASLPRIPSHMVFSLYIGLAVSSTMGRAFSLSCCPELRLHTVLVSETFFWIRCKSSIVHKCSTQFPCFQRRHWEHCIFKFRTLLNSRIISFDFCWMDFGRYSAASPPEVLLDEDEFRSSVQDLELGDVLLPLQRSVTVLLLWNQFCVPLFWSTVTSLPVPLWSFSTCLGVNTQHSVDSCPHTVLPRTRWICDNFMFLLIESVAFKLGTFQGFSST